MYVVFAKVRIVLNKSVYNLMIFIQTHIINDLNANSNGEIFRGLGVFFSV